MLLLYKNPRPTLAWIIQPYNWTCNLFYPRYGRHSDKKEFSHRQWRNHAREITGSARVEFISARAVISTENELGVLCLSITSNEVFRFKTVMYIFKDIGPNYSIL